jgi:S-adenosylmethionine synthetase
VDIPAIVRNTIVEIGYHGINGGFDGKTCAVLVALGEQSGDIAQGVNNAYESKAAGNVEKETGAGDQGMVFDYPSDETPEYMSAPISYKVDRSAAYAARWIAKNLVVAGLAKRLELEIAYAVGVAQPVSIRADTFGTGKLPDERIAEIVGKEFDLRPDGIIRQFNLCRPIYRQTAAYGHFGRIDIDLPWEKTDRAEELKKYR